MFRKLIKAIFLIVLISITWVVKTYHVGVMAPPRIEKNDYQGESGIWISKKEMGINQVVLKGSAYRRGLEFGKLTRDLLFLQEKELLTFFEEFIPQRFLQQMFILGLIRWFWGVEKFFDVEMLKEMLGVSKSTSSQFDYLADKFTRQVAYHGLHEVGQMFVDSNHQNMGCTVLGIPYKESWIIGRNFDFEAGRIFDSEKIMKWTFPKHGHAYLSIIWAGMVGAVTGINQYGVFISINAAGSEDFRRFGTPSTLVVTKALQYAKNAEQARDIIVNSQMFITDIFIVLDRKNSTLYRIEKSPERASVEKIQKHFVTTNHLFSEIWKKDKINEMRKKELTTLQRYSRGNRLISKILEEKESDLKNIEERALDFLRDKKLNDNQNLPLGNRGSIDALIATHAVIYNAFSNVIYVSQGPSLVGEFVGFDLDLSFKKGRPVRASKLKKDPDISRDTYLKVKNSYRLIKKAQSAIDNQDCSLADTLINSARPLYANNSNFFLTQGDYYFKCLKDRKKAINSWRKAQELYPAYQKERRYLKERLKQ